MALPAAESSWLGEAAKRQLRGVQRSVRPLVLCRCLGYVRHLGKCPQWRFGLQLPSMIGSSKLSGGTASCKEQLVL